MTQRNRYVNCNLCAADEYEVLFEAGKAQIHRIVKCKKCELIYANPQTDNVTGVENNYAVSSEDTLDELSHFNKENHPYLHKQYLQLKDYASILDHIDHEERGLLLEVGSYAGVFLNEAKQRGWQVLGIEPLELPALYSEKEFGIRVIRQYFEESDIPNESVSVIVSNHVIEHVPDPKQFVKHAHDLLRKNGKLILETPTYDSLSFKILGHRERSVRCEGHIYFFTEKTLRKLVEDNGFTVIDYEKVGRTLTLDRLFYNFGVITGKPKFFAAMSKKFNLHKLTMTLNMRDMQRIYCMKKQVSLMDKHQDTE